jgi:hypothetical protein
MSKILIDSSVWIHYFKSGKGQISEEVNLLLDENRVVLCGMVELEIYKNCEGKSSL